LHPGTTSSQQSYTWRRVFGKTNVTLKSSRRRLVLRRCRNSFPAFLAGKKVAWFWNDNLLVQRRWAKDLLRELAGLDRWWLTQPHPHSGYSMSLTAIVNAM
jgi:hypothetical protein